MSTGYEKLSTAVKKDCENDGGVFNPNNSKVTIFSCQFLGRRIRRAKSRML